MGNKIPIKHYFFHGFFLPVYGLVKYFPSPIGDILRKFVLAIFGCHYKKVRIYEGVTIWYPYNISIGENTTLNEWVYISGYGRVKIGRGVRIGHRTSIISSDHNIPKKGESFVTSGISQGEVLISDNVFIGCNVTILKGVSIGEGSVIGAGSVVSKDVPARTIVGGVPAKTISEY